MESAPFTEALLPTQRDAIAPDGSQVRLLVRLPGGSMAHFELGPGEVSRSIQHRTVSEAWYIVQGLGRMWRRQGGTEREIDLRPGTALTIPVGTAFQFRSTGFEPLRPAGELCSSRTYHCARCSDALLIERGLDVASVRRRLGHRNGLAYRPLVASTNFPRVTVRLIRRVSTRWCSSIRGIILAGLVAASLPGPSRPLR